MVQVGDQLVVVLEEGEDHEEEMDNVKVKLESAQHIFIGTHPDGPLMPTPNYHLSIVYQKLLHTSQAAY